MNFNIKCNSNSLQLKENTLKKINELNLKINDIDNINDLEHINNEISDLLDFIESDNNNDITYTKKMNEIMKIFLPYIIYSYFYLDF
jgi:hypothetical protein